MTKTIYITGASSGIGRATAIAMAGAGWRVLAGVRTQQAAEALRAEHGSILPVHVDITQQSSIDAVAKVVAKEVGDHGLDVLFNNAGVPASGPAEFIPLQQFRDVFEANLFGHIAVTQSVLPLIRQAKGRILFTSSTTGKFAPPFMSPYSSSKHAIEGLADAWRHELRPLGVDVVLIEPGGIATSIWEKGLDPAVQDFGPEAEAVYGKGMAWALDQGQTAAKMAIPAEKAAAIIRKAIEAKKPRIRYLIGVDAHLATRMNRFAPGVLDTAISAVMKRDAKKR
ncbi:short-chain dehydrogenase/reductase [Nocardioides baekrokdamisoli]|uniref:Short-chain dehydrogenase/reductase n=1 Tax=Nocardioides baekrokdamisoli TaxID=1804624 RepID=A0A3G9IWD8_9ACTN|nr:SDR family oxidoreductase [Nocardioides baekrokdamisoli]BBH16663.1 short-chain dehydrogenase/reductase [Nocardioides baekrokdamisoli]